MLQVLVQIIDCVNGGLFGLGNALDAERHTSSHDSNERSSSYQNESTFEREDGTLHVPSFSTSFKRITGSRERLTQIRSH
jgi:hypothetical protein